LFWHPAAFFGEVEPALLIFGAAFPEMELLPVLSSEK
jgi:hypothetical protein